MKSFLEHIKEEVLPTVQVSDGGLDIEKPAVRAAINAAIAGVVSQPAVTPYVVYNRLSKLLAQYHIALPRKFLEGDKGVEVFEVKQFGHKMGMTDSGEFINQVPSTHYLFIQYGIITPHGITYAKPLVGGMFRVMARLVDKDELDKLLDMAEITLGLHEDAECRQNSAKAAAPRDPMHDITSDPKKVGNKKAVGTSEKKSIDEELSHGARELTLHADNDAQLHRSSHQPIIKNLQRKHDKGTYDHDKATKLWKYHADRAAKSYEKQHGGKFSVADRKQAASHFADSARHEHGFGSVKESRMPASVIKHKQRIANMTPEEKAKKFAGKSEEQLKSMARRHGFGKDSNEYSKTVKEENLDELYGKGRLPEIQAHHEKMKKELERKAVQHQNASARADSLKYNKGKDKFGWGPFHRNDYWKKKDVKEETLEEKAPPGAKFERMVKHIKKGYSKDGLSAKEKSIAYATAWKAKKNEKGE